MKNNFKKISIKLASSEKILKWSYGEIKNSFYINYKNLSPELNGLFCLKIFSNNDILNNDYKFNYNDNFFNLKKSHSSYKFGHINLIYPVLHIWFLKTLNNNISNILNISSKIIYKILNFKIKIVIKSFNKKFKKYSIIIKKYKNLFTMYGVKAFYKLLTDNEILLDCKIIKKKIFFCKSFNLLFFYLNKINKIYIFYLSGNKPNWFCLKIIPVVPPKIRPLVPLNIGKFAISDLNELYKRIINRNLRLKNLTLLKIPKQILINERILLQESVSALFDNEKVENPILTNCKRILKSFSNSIKGKYGRFRQNLLGKRVDFSARTVISVGPYLKIYQCEIPILVCLELLKPFLYNKFKKYENVNNINFVDIFYINNKKKTLFYLKKICKNKNIILNRAPTLHRMGIQSFKIILTKDKTIKINPLMCLSYNADFDGDQMAIHLPLSINSQIETNELLLSINNILSPCNGDPIIIPTQDIVMGIYCLTYNYNNYFIKFKSFKKVFYFFNKNNINIINNIIINNILTTVGRIVFYFLIKNILNINFINKILKKKDLIYIIKYCFDYYGIYKTIKILDRIKKIGFCFSTYFGITISYDDLISLKQKKSILKIFRKVNYKNNIFNIINILEKIFLNLIIKNLIFKKKNFINNLFIMLDSGSRGTILQIKQLIAFRGFFSKSNGDIILKPIIDNLKKGLTMENFFISSFGARKGLTDTSLKTANSGYLTRKLVDVLQDIVIYKIDCETSIGIEIKINNFNNVYNFYKKIFGRIILENVYFNNFILIKKNTFINNKILFLIIKKNISIFHIRSVMYCISSRGVCSFCYGADLSTSKLSFIGLPIGIIAAQSIGEPGTQLTMRTFHTGGVATYYQNYDYLLNNIDGVLIFKDTKCLLNKNGNIIILNNKSYIIIYKKKIKIVYKLLYGDIIFIRNSIFVKKNNKIKNFNNYFNIYSEGIGVFYIKGIIKNFFCFVDNKFYYKVIKKSIIIVVNKYKNKKYFIPKNFLIIKKKYNFILPGDIIAKINIKNIYKSSIIGGLPRLSELFEVRIPKKKTLISEVDGIVCIYINKENIIVINIISKFGFLKKYTTNYLRKIFVNNGDIVKIGDLITDGKPDLNDILKFIGIEYLLIFFIEEINNIYTPQGILINEKHIEIVLKQMTKKVKILYSGDCFYLKNDILYLEDVLIENLNTLKFSKKISLYERVIFGITKVSLESLSFFSAASFQETNKILIDSAIRNRIDYLLGLKENVVIGKAIPAGTGLLYHFLTFSKNNYVIKKKIYKYNLYN
ncbi:MAG: DNA-directed RNA polymerase subunit beta' [Candidatus Carsonella ruddii]